MRDGTDLGKKHCLRPLIAFDSPNSAMTDPVMYRFPKFAAKEDGQDAEPALHHRTHWLDMEHLPHLRLRLPRDRQHRGRHPRAVHGRVRRPQHPVSLVPLRPPPPTHPAWDFARINSIRAFLSKGRARPARRHRHRNRRDRGVV